MDTPGNENKNFMARTITDDERWSKQAELTSGMSIANQAPDEYENKIKSLGGEN